MTISSRHQTDISRLISEKSPRNAVLSPKAQRKSITSSFSDRCSGSPFRLMSRLPFPYDSRPLYSSDVPTFLFILRHHSFITMSPFLFRPMSRICFHAVFGLAFCQTFPSVIIYLLSNFSFCRLSSFCRPISFFAYFPFIGCFPPGTCFPCVGCLELILTFLLPS
jgi:hypothetical protein